jgi:hypothetical protein
MKLTKIKLLKLIKKNLEEFGYKEIKDTLTGANGLFIKPINNSFFLSLGLTISNYYESRFTASFYLSKTTRWSSIWGDIPNEAYERVGSFLTAKERGLYLDEEHNADGVTDAWWNSNKQDHIDNFLRTIYITEERFLKQPHLFTKIENSLEVKQLVEYVLNVLNVLNNEEDGKYDYRFQPKKNIDDIPSKWFKAAERVLKKKNGILNDNTVKLLASDAWRQNLFTPQSSPTLK